MGSKRQYPVGLRLSVHCSVDESSYGKGLPRASIVVEIVEDRGGDGTYICADNTYGDVADGYYSWLQTEERFYASSWDSPAMRSHYEDLSYDRRMMGGNRIKMDEAVMMAKTLTKIHKGIIKAQDKTGLSVSTFDSYLRLLMISMKPAFVVVRKNHEEHRLPAMDGDLLNAYNQLHSEVQAFWEKVVQSKLAA